MAKLYTFLSAVALLFVLAVPGPASADERRADGARNLDQHEYSAHRRRYRHSHRYVRRYYSGPRVYYGAPYYPYYGRPYYGRPYWGPGVYAGPGISFGFGFGPRHWW